MAQERVSLEGAKQAHEVAKSDFEMVDGGTRIRYIADLRLKGVVRLVEPLMRGRLRKVGSDAMAGMKEALASQR